MHVVILSAAEKWPSVVTVLETFTLQRCTADKRWSAQQSTAVDVGADFAFCTTAPHCRVLTIDVCEALFAFYNWCSSFCSFTADCRRQSTVLCCRAQLTLPLMLQQPFLCCRALSSAAELCLHYHCCCCSRLCRKIAGFENSSLEMFSLLKLINHGWFPSFGSGKFLKWRIAMFDGTKVLVGKPINEK